MFKFGTSGIRDLTENLLKEHIAAELAQKLAAMGWQELTLGRDGRRGSEQLMQEFVANFPGKIHNLGITTTPALSANDGLAVMITASHNPSIYCGFKVFLNHYEQSTADIKPVPVYHKWDLLPKDVVIDCANGGLGHILREQGFAQIINYEGEINKDCGATHPENIEKYCREHDLEIGFAVDGDADRCLVYLNDHVLAGEEVMMLIGTILKLPTLVVDDTVNSAIGNYFQIIRCQIGGHSVIQTMNEHNVVFGAEKSGHYYFDMHMGTSDALDAIILIADAYKKMGLEGLLAITNKYQPYHQLNKNLNLTDLPDNFEEILQNIKLPQGIRQLIRKSGTEPLLRIMLEGEKDAVDKAWQQVATALKIN